MVLLKSRSSVSGSLPGFASEVLTDTDALGISVGSPSHLPERQKWTSNGAAQLHQTYKWSDHHDHMNHMYLHPQNVIGEKTQKR